LPRIFSVDQLKNEINYLKIMKKEKLRRFCCEAGMHVASPSLKASKQMVAWDSAGGAGDLFRKLHGSEQHEINP
jgi:hypothetical protein